MASEFKRRACQPIMTIQKQTLLAMLTEGSKTKEFFDSIDDDDWEIISFDPKTSEACVKITTDTTINTLAVTLPKLVFK